MAEGTRVYGIGSVSFNWGNVDLMEGVAEGSEITVSDTVPEKWTQHDVGVAGAHTVQVLHPSTSGMVTVDVDTSTDLYQLLRAIQAQDRITRNQVATGTLEDHSTGESETLDGMRISTKPPRVKGFDRSVATFAWIFSHGEYVPGGGNENLIGDGIAAADPLGPPAS